MMALTRGWQNLDKISVASDRGSTTDRIFWGSAVVTKAKTNYRLENN
jgi:hypothetical protein